MDIDVSKLDMICGEEGAAIYEDGDYWVWYDIKGAEQILKSESPFLPLSQVTKYDMKAVNHKRLEELNEELGRRLDASKVRETLEGENDRPSITNEICSIHKYKYGKNKCFNNLRFANWTFNWLFGSQRDIFPSL
jgi:hypothetical protein